MIRTVTVALVCLGVVGVAVTVAAVKPVNVGHVFGSGPSCALGGTGGFMVPDGSCTPGERGGANELVVPGAVRGVCEKQDDRPNFSFTRRKIIAAYGLDPSNFNGELDHLVPRWLGGRDTRKNLWPEPGDRPNAKDDLESGPRWSIRYRVCIAHTMPVDAAIKVFEGDWRVGWCRYEPAPHPDWCDDL
jgi:hypothetical protein